MNLKIMTFNLRFGNEADGINNFDNRLPRIIETVKSEMPDIVGFQEATDVMRAALRQSLDGYAIIGCGRKQNYRGEGVCIAYRQDVIELVEYTTFWLSDTPKVAGSRYENSDQSVCPRVTVAAKLSPEGYDGCITFVNTHLDHKGAVARVKGMKQIAEYIESVEGTFVLTGDMNALPDSDCIAVANSITGARDVTAGIKTTFHDFGRRKEDFKIDYIFTNAAPVCAYAVEDKPVDGVWISDHYPVCAEIEI